MDEEDRIMEMLRRQVDALDGGPTQPLEDALAAYGKLVRDMLARHGDRIHALELRVEQLEAERPN